MPANFPNSPTLNQQYSYAGATWSWTGAYWQQIETSLVSGTSLVPTANVTYDLGSTNLRWRDLYLSGNTIDLGGTAIKSSANGVTFTSAANAQVGIPITVSSIQLSTGGNTVTLVAGTSGLQTVSNTGATVPIAGGGFTFSNTAPTSPTVGSRWLDSESGKEFIWVVAGATGVWMQAVGAGGGTAAGNTSSGGGSGIFSWYMS